MDDRYSLICRNLESVRQKIVRASHRSGRKSDDIRLVVVSKGQPVEVMQAAIRAGVTQFGENYPEEAVKKKQMIDAPLVWHMIGHLQSRKIPIVVQHFSLLHSLDRLSIAQKLNRQLVQCRTTFPVLLEVNIGSEASKFGWNISSDELRERFFADIQQISSLDRLKIQGLMTMPPYDLDPEQSRVWFQRTRELRDILGEIFPDQRWDELSMGTSHDFEVAIEEGGTFVRIGEAILGARMPRILSEL